MSHHPILDRSIYGSSVGKVPKLSLNSTNLSAEIIYLRNNTIEESKIT